MYSPDAIWRLGSVIVTPEKGVTGSSDAVVCAPVVPVMVGAVGGSKLDTLVLSSETLPKFKTSLAVKPVSGGPAVGV